LWQDQVSLLAWFEEIFGVRSGGVNKTRGIGLSWLTAGFLFHKWLFESEVSIAVLTKDKDLLDGPTPNATIGKFQYFYDNLPEWAKFTANGNPLLYRTTEKHTFINKGNQAVIQGFVSTSTKLRQLRFTIIFADEFAFYDRTDQEEWMTSSQGCTNCRLFVSTWNGFDDCFHRIMHEEESSLLRMSAFWHNNLARWAGAYKIEGGRVVYVDKDYQHPANYQFGVPDLVPEGMLRSPWVDAELLEPGVDRIKTLRDIYGMPVASRTNSFFNQNVVTWAQQSVARSQPDREGKLVIVNGDVEITPTLKSNIRVWGGVPNEDRGPYIVFCDLAQGVGDAFSVMCALDSGGEQVLEYGVNDKNLIEFASDVVALCRWLAGKNGDGWVLLDFEANGPFADPFKSELRRQNYGRIHQTEHKFQKKTAHGEVSKYDGTTNRDGGLKNLRELERAIESLECTVRSPKVANDMRLCGIDRDKNDQPCFPRGRRDGHGDFAQAIAGAWWRAKDFASLENRVKSSDERRASIEQLVPADERPSLWSDDWN